MEHIPKYRHPVRVVNPISLWHTVKLMPCQRLELRLRPPSVFITGANPEDTINYKLTSDFLFINDVDRKDNNLNLMLSQKFDLSSWVPYGQVFLGNLVLTINNKNVDYNCILVIILNSENDKIMTVVNPIKQIVKIQPHQSLSVVCSSIAVNSLWQFEIKSNDSGMSLNKFGSSSVNKDHKDESTLDSFPVKTRSDLCINPRLVHKKIVQDELEYKSIPEKEHFYWFGLSETDLKKTTEMEDDVHALGNLVFSPVKILPNNPLRSLSVLLDVKGKNRYKITKTKQDLTSRSENMDKNILRNPVDSEVIDFHGVHNEMTIEIASPSCFWKDLDDKVSWDLTLDANKITNITAKDLPNLSQWGKTIQRFKVSYSSAFRGNSAETEHVGAIILSCLPKKDENGGIRRVSFWFTPKDEEGKEKERKTVHQSCGSYCGPSISKKDEPQICEVKFEEVFGDFHHGVELKETFQQKQKSTDNKSSESKKKVKEDTVMADGQIDDNDFMCRTIINPRDNEKITFDHKKPLIFRMSKPSKIFSDECENQLWSIETDLEYDCFVSKQDNHYQELKMKNSYQDGTTGFIKFICSKETRTVFLEVINGYKKVEYTSDSVNTFISKENKLHVSQWKHGDISVIGLSQSFTINNPISGWDESQWSLEIQQLTLPNAVWKHKLVAEFAHKIDMQNLWFNKSAPFFLTNKWHFRPIENQQTFARQVLLAASEVVGKDVFPVMKLIFRNSVHPENTKVTTAFGIVEVANKTERVFNVCVSVKDLLDKGTTYDNPLENESLIVSDGETLTIKIDKLNLKNQQDSWMILSHPSDMINFRDMKIVNDQNVFRFIARKVTAPSNVITFFCSEVEKKFFVRVI